jgi:pyridoxal/pyridoxine/pyridoxamine kinase
MKLFLEAAPPLNLKEEQAEREVLSEAEKLVHRLLKKDWQHAEKEWQQIKQQKNLLQKNHQH